MAGKVQQHSITLVEGWNFRQVRAALAAETRLQSTLPDLDDQAVMARLDAADQHPEGWYPSSKIETKAFFNLFWWLPYHVGQ